MKNSAICQSFFFISLFLIFHKILTTIIQNIQIQYIVAHIGGRGCIGYIKREKSSSSPNPPQTLNQVQTGYPAFFNARYQAAGRQTMDSRYKENQPDDQHYSCTVVILSLYCSESFCQRIIYSKLYTAGYPARYPGLPDIRLSAQARYP